MPGQQAVPAGMQLLQMLADKGAQGNQRFVERGNAAMSGDVGAMLGFTGFTAPVAGGASMLRAAASGPIQQAFQTLLSHTKKMPVDDLLQFWSRARGRTVQAAEAAGPAAKLEEALLAREGFRRLWHGTRSGASDTKVTEAELRKLTDWFNTNFISAEQSAGQLSGHSYEMLSAADRAIQEAMDALNASRGMP